MYPPKTLSHTPLLSHQPRAIEQGICLAQAWNNIFSKPACNSYTLDPTVSLIFPLPGAITVQRFWTIQAILALPSQYHVSTLFRFPLIYHVFGIPKHGNPIPFLTLNHVATCASRPTLFRRVGGMYFAELGVPFWLDVSLSLRLRQWPWDWP